MKPVLKNRARVHGRPILDYVLYENGVFFSTDLEHLVARPCRIDGYPEDTPVLFHRKWLAVVYKHCRGALKFSDGKLNGFDIPAHNLKFAEYPRFVKPGSQGPASSRATISRADLVGLRAAAAKSDVRYYLNGVFFDAGKRVGAATDGHRIHLIESLKMSGADSFIIPAASIDLILAEAGTSDNINIAYFLSERSPVVRMTIEGAHGTISSLVIDGKFPDYTKVIPGGPYVGNVTINTDCGIDDIKQYLALASAQPSSSKIVVCKFMDERLSGDIEMDTGNITVSGVYSVEFQPRYIVDAMRFVCEPVSRFFLSSRGKALSAAVVRSGNKTAVVMSCRG